MPVSRTERIRMIVARIAFKVIVLLILGLVLNDSPIRAEGRSLEFRFELSDDAGSEFSVKLPVYSPGLLKLDAEWRPVTLPAGHAATQTALTIILLRPNGTEAARTNGPSPLRFEMRVTEQDFGTASDRAGWSVKIINSSVEDRREVRGALRTIIPVTSGNLAETDFVLLGAGNAKEITFPISAPGKLVIEAGWQTEPQTDATSSPASLTISLVHSGEEKVYARRQGRSPLRIEQQIAESLLYGGVRWVVRIENNNAIKVRGRIKVVFAPSI